MGSGNRTIPLGGGTPKRQWGDGAAFDSCRAWRGPTRREAGLLEDPADQRMAAPGAWGRGIGGQEGPGGAGGTGLRADGWGMGFEEPARLSPFGCKVGAGIEDVAADADEAFG